MPVTNLKTALDASENKSEHFKKKLLPPLGAVGQVIMKTSPSDFHVTWSTLTLYHITGAGDAAGKNVGTGPNDVAAANDSRFSNEREPTAHDNSKHTINYEPELNIDQKRKISFGITDPTGGSDGDIYLQYEDV